MDKELKATCNEQAQLEDCSEEESIVLQTLILIQNWMNEFFFLVTSNSLIYIPSSNVI